MKEEKRIRNTTELEKRKMEDAEFWMERRFRVKGFEIEINEMKDECTEKLTSIISSIEIDTLVSSKFGKATYITDGITSSFKEELVREAMKKARIPAAKIEKIIAAGYEEKPKKPYILYTAPKDNGKKK